MRNSPDFSMVLMNQAKQGSRKQKAYRGTTGNALEEQLFGVRVLRAIGMYLKTIVIFCLLPIYLRENHVVHLSNNK